MDNESNPIAAITMTTHNDTTANATDDRRIDLGELVRVMGVATEGMTKPKQSSFALGGARRVVVDDSEKLAALSFALLAEGLHAVSCLSFSARAVLKERGPSPAVVFEKTVLCQDDACFDLKGATTREAVEQQTKMAFDQWNGAMNMHCEHGWLAQDGMMARNLPLPLLRAATECVREVLTLGQQRELEASTPKVERVRAVPRMA